MFAGSWSEQVINFFVFILLARLLGAEAFGLSTMAIVFVLFAEFLVRQSISDAIIQIDKLEDGHLEVVFWLLAVISIILFLLLVAFSHQIADFYSAPEIADYLAWVAPTVLFIGFSGVPVGLLRRDMQFSTMAIRATVGVAGGGIVGIVMALQGFGVWSFIAQRIVQVFLNNLLAWTARPWLPKFSFEKRHFHDVIGFSSNVFGLRCAELIAINSPMVIIGATLGPVALGFYTISWRLVEVLSFLITTPVQMVAQPAFAHLNRLKQDIANLLLTVSRVSALLAFPGFLGLAAVSPYLIHSLFGPEWAEASQTHQVLCLAGIYFAIEKLQQSICLGLGKAKGIFYIAALESALGVAIMITLSRFGIFGVAAGFVARYFAMWPFRSWIVLQLTGLKPLNYLAALTLPLLNACIMVVLVAGWQWMVAETLSGLAILITSVFTGIVGYSLLIWLTMRQQIESIVQFIKQFAGKRPSAAPK